MSSSSFVNGSSDRSFLPVPLGASLGVLLGGVLGAVVLAWGSLRAGGGDVERSVVTLYSCDGGVVRRWEAVGVVSSVDGRFRFESGRGVVMVSGSVVVEPVVGD